VTIIVGLLFLVAGLVVSAYSGVLETRVAEGRPLPLWKNLPGYRRPPVTLGWQVAAILLVGISALFFLTEWGPIAILLISAAFVPPLVVVAIHNRSVRANR